MSRSILLLGSYPPPFGGISSHLHSLVPFLRMNGFELDIVSPGEIRGVEQKDGFRVFRLPKRERDYVGELGRRLPALAAHAASLRMFDRELLKCESIVAAGERIIAERRGTVELISAYHLIPWALAGALLARRFRVPLVVTNFGEIYTQPAYYRRRSKQVRRIVTEARRVMASSLHCARSYSRIGLNVRVEVVPYGIEMEAFAGDHRDEARARLGLQPDRPVALFFGRLIRDMGLHTCLDAARLLLARRDDAAFVIAGAKGELQADAEALAAAHPARVKVAVNVPFTAMRDYYHAADVVLAPSADDRACMGLAIKEAMASARPVVATRVGGVPEAVVDGETGVLVAPEDPIALADAVASLFAAPAEMRRMGDAARRRCQALFDVESTKRRVLDIFGDAIGSSGAAALTPSKER
jgi:glycosyltransferase involved in cell wall biosynthesis